MNTRTFGLSRFTAAACATLITAVSGWAFVHSTASSERDPFQFAAVMAANAKAHVAQVQSRTAYICRNKSGSPAHPVLGSAPVCLKG
jgi:hypothetical protein